MQTIPYSDVQRLLKTKELSFHNIYNADISILSYYAYRYYSTHKHDTMETDQKLTKFYLDIELYAPGGIDDFTDAIYTINAITTCDSINRIFKSYYLLNDQNFEKFGIKSDLDFDYNGFIQQLIVHYKTIMIKEGYIDDSFNLEIYIFTDELELLKSFWQGVHQIDPDILTGWNSDFFDFPYIHNRDIKLFGVENACRLASKFGRVTVKNDRISIPEFVIADLLYLFKPRDEGGLNLGKKLGRYTLDNVADVVLGLKKLEYHDKNMTLNEFYINDPINFLLYNIIDVALCVQLDFNCKHVDLYNSIRRIMTTPFGSSIAGSSVTFDSYIYTELMKDNKFIRYGINSEVGKNMEIEDLQQFPQPKDKKSVPMKPIKIPSRTFSNVISRFPGAFVKDPIPKIINDGSLVIDLDAASLYPSMILQSNMSFDSYRARVIPPTVYKTLDLIGGCISKGPYPDMLPLNIEKMVWNYIDRKDVDKKKQTATTLYYIVLKLFDILAKSGFTIEQLFEPQSSEASIILRNTLIPLLDVINMIHPENPGHNRFAYDYLFLNNPAKLEELYPTIYVIHEPGETGTYIRRYYTRDCESIITQFTFTLAGTMFEKHNVKMGLFTNFLQRLGDLRKHYKNLRQQSSKGSYEYVLNDNRQASVKVVMNTTYGLYGLSSFRYSNHWLAQSITNNGELTIKLAQFLAEEHLTFKYGEI